MADRYGSFAELAAREKRGRDYDIVIREVSGAPATIVAPHAGLIERGTSEIAVTIAAADLSLYLFEAKGPDAYNLHITSHRFDEPGCLALVARSAVVVTVHGCAYKDGDETVWLGGRDEARRDAIGVALRAAGFKAAVDTRNPGRHPTNICNRGLTGKGVQLEFERALRTKARRDMGVRRAIAEAVRVGMGV